MNIKTVAYVGILGGLSVASVGLVMGDEDESRWQRLGGIRQDVVPVDNQLYAQECGSCHFAYQPGLLPAATWAQIMQGLADHFGENAELPQPELKAINGYLDANAADRAGYSRFAGIGRFTGDNRTMRITDTAYFQRKHHEVPARLVSENPDVGSFSRCDACHAGAAKGNYDEHQVRIPGVARWSDN